MNTSNTTAGPMEEMVTRPLFSYFSLTITLFFLTPLLLFNILLTVVVATEKSIVGTFRLVLVNIITAGQVVIVGLMMFFIANVIISGSWCPELRPSDFACRLMYWVIVSGGAARLMYMTTFAISVYVLVRYGARKMKIQVAIVTVIGVWLAVLLPNAVIFSPDVVLINFHDNDTCPAHNSEQNIRLSFTHLATLYKVLTLHKMAFGPIFMHVLLNLKSHVLTLAHEVYFLIARSN